MTTELAVSTDPRFEIQARTPLSEQPGAVYLASLGPRSQRVQRQALQAILDLAGHEGDPETFPWGEIRFQHAAAIRAKLAELYSPATANRYLSALRGALGAAFDLGLLGADDLMRVKRIKRVKGSTLPAGRSLTQGEIHAMADVCEETAKGVRDAALFGVLYCGLRRAEIVALDLVDFDADALTLRVMGKGSKERSVPIINGAGLALAEWVSIRGSQAGPLFHPIAKGSKIHPRRMSNQSIYNLVQDRGRQAGVKDLSPHDFRRTVAGDLLDAGNDISLVQKILGHASPVTTARYDRRPEAAKSNAMSKLHFPHRKRVLLSE